MAREVTLTMKGDGLGRFWSTDGKVFYCSDLENASQIEVQAREIESQKRREAREYLKLFVENRDKVVTERGLGGLLDAEDTARNVLAEMERRFGVKL